MENDLWLWNTNRDVRVFNSRGQIIDGYGYREGSSADPYTAKLIRRGVLYVVPGGIPGRSGTEEVSEPETTETDPDSAPLPEPGTTTEEDQ